MITKKTFLTSLTIMAALIIYLGITTPIFAQTTTKTGANQSARIAKIITRSDTAINARITTLNNLSARIAGMKNVDSATKSTITNNIQTSLNEMTALKAKIDADTVLSTLQADAKSIIGNYRIYALIVPQGYLAASTDRIATISGLMSNIGIKLQTRITLAQSAGHDVTSLQATLTDISSKIADAKTQAQNAEASVATLIPDNGNTTQFTANNTAIKTARSYIKTATQDLQAARQDIKTILTGLKGFISTTKAKTTTN